jgi:hypothetical protein
MSFQPGMISVSVSFFGFVVVLLLAFAAVKALWWVFSHLNESRGWFALLALTLLGLLFVGYAGIRTTHVITGDEIAVHSTQIPPLPPGYNTFPPAPPVAAMTPPAEQPAQQDQSMEELWKQLTAPRINLEETTQATSDAPTAGPSSPQELTNAAKLILSASVPGADPFTQGWLIDAAKSILNATPKPKASFPGNAGNDQARPEWVSDPSKATSDMHRVVSTDPLRTIEECRDQLEKRLRFAVADRVRWLAKEATGRSVGHGPTLADMGVTPDYILRELCPQGAYIDTVADGAGEMKRGYALLEYTPEKDAILLQRWQSATGARGSEAGIVELAAANAMPSADAFKTGERPHWIDAPPKQIGNVRKFVVVSDPYLTAEESRRDADQKMQNLTLNRAGELSGASLARRNGAAALADLGLGGDYVRRELCTDEFIDVIDTSVGEMRKTYSLLEFNEAQDALLIDRARSYARQEGLFDVMLIGGGLLASIATLFGLLKVDTWTRGYYTKRLFLGVPATIITIVALLAMS